MSQQLVIIGKASLDETLAWHPQPRFTCPFYGFAFEPKFDAMVDQSNNRCGCINDPSQFCDMQTAGERPDWKTCTKNTLANLSEARTTIKVFPREFTPDGEEYRWRGLSFSIWEDYILSPQTPRYPD